VEHGRTIELHREAIAFAQAVALVTQRDVGRPFEHPHLLVNTHVAPAGFECDARSSTAHAAQVVCSASSFS
jgi:hypothetical protein